MFATYADFVIVLHQRSLHIIGLTLEIKAIVV